MKKKFCVIGLGNFGFHVVSTLYEQGHEVTAIDTDKEKVQSVKDICSYAILGDAASKEFLSAQGVNEMDAVVVSTGERTHLSTLITLYLKELKVRRILVKAIGEDHGRILEKVGASDVIYPEKDMAIRIAHSLSTPNILEFIPLAEEYSISESAPPKHFIGKTLIDLDLRRKFKITVIAIKDVLSDQFIPAPPPTHMIKDSDVLIVIGKTEDVGKALNK
ncbi:Trk K+ transport system, NAD-binding component [Desulfuromonas soudanensis]|uniref:Trk K+ transport system, NAD-binding component n=1 Tax=Desulfuromonas soudanensis TaxID=1603606 RepID=A0A0M4CZD0_9BACT|nr:TrkA family potassium uptake protein [Desulfuromonas soudanensis]ALC18041.1 Trk K+ transport system, NAD-binding component [Desulfuromonas soudanensis]